VIAPLTRVATQTLPSASTRVSAMNPTTPPGLAFGAAAALVIFPGQDSGEVFFLDGDQACTPMPILKVLVDLLILVGDGTITHLGQGMYTRDRNGDSARSPSRPGFSSQCLEQRPADSGLNQGFVLRTG
jgi:hypothetical protein